MLTSETGLLIFLIILIGLIIIISAVLGDISRKLVTKDNFDYLAKEQSLVGTAIGWSTSLITIGIVIITFFSGYKGLIIFLIVVLIAIFLTLFIYSILVTENIKKGISYQQNIKLYTQAKNFSIAIGIIICITLAVVIIYYVVIWYKNNPKKVDNSPKNISNENQNNIK